jgi:plasmid stabilization system protein ParE
MIIIESKDFVDELKNILAFISKDNKTAAKNFRKSLSKKIDNLKDFPFMYRVSIYFDNENIRDLVYKGYTVVYEVDLDKEIITIIGIVKYRKNLK